MHPNKRQQRKEKYGLTNWAMQPRGQGDDLFVYLFWILVLALYGLGFWLVSKSPVVGIALILGGVAFTFIGIYGDDDD